ncbi:MAG: indolepyruvate ferredoxin oxidoreductase subunit alpha [Bilifractor sp.]
MKAVIDQEKCVGCGACIINCPVKAIHMLPGWHAEVEPEKCIGCGTCVRICHREAPYLIGTPSEK